MKDPKLELRDRAHEVQLVVENGQTRPVIGTSEPTDEEDQALQARVRATQHWGGGSSPRLRPDGGVTEPMALRSRTVLSLRLPQEMRRALDEGVSGHGKVPESGVVAKVRLRK